MTDRAFRACCFVWLLLASAGCQSSPPPEGPAVEVLSFSKDIAWGNAAWADELRERFPNALIVSVHGASRDGELWLWPDEQYVPMHADTAAQVLKALYPGRPVVFVSCNADGRPLSVRGAWYARTTVAANPLFSLPGWASDAEDFVEGGTRPATRPVIPD